METAREQVLRLFAIAGLDEAYFNRMGAAYWIDYIIEYKNTGKCGSVNWSTVEFLPVIAKLLGAISSQQKEFPRIGLVVDGILGYYSMREAIPLWDSGWREVELSGKVLEKDMRTRPMTKEEERELQNGADEYSANK